jgi:hypothetical protein
MLREVGPYVPTTVSNLLLKLQKGKSAPLGAVTL